MGKSSFPTIKVLLGSEKDTCAISILDELVDHSIVSMASTMVGKFIRQRPNIDIVRTFTQKKWNLKGQVTVTAMAKGILCFDFSCNEDLSNILCEGPLVIGRSTLVLQKWSSKLDLNDSSFFCKLRFGLDFQSFLWSSGMRMCSWEWLVPLGCFYPQTR